ncbi:transcriptional regulator [Rhizobium laguerreae]|uniref:transcriptional regulator n=1 Tax=Rhizobium laguerreae TaxID=1076926 RepID=UPI001C906E14|nr:transcriptional regulator [Rhizobium laguerreae]MBY3151102.1 transcriptional regulator [Rhizobium laguerreae]
MPTLTGMHLRAARALLRWRVQDLARKSRVPIETLKRAELLDGPANMTAPEQEAVIKVLQMAGVSLIEDPVLGFGAAFNRQPRSSDLIG